MNNLYRTLIVLGSGIAAGAAATLLALGLQLQTRYLATLFTLNTLAGMGAAQCAISLVRAYEEQVQMQQLARADLSRAIGVISERYAQQPDQQQVLIALRELEATIDERR